MRRSPRLRASKHARQAYISIQGRTSHGGNAEDDEEETRAVHRPAQHLAAHHHDPAGVGIGLHVHAAAREDQPGLDIQGGLSVVLTAKSTDGADVTNDDMEKSRAIIESRVNALGASEAVVQVQGTDQILVQIPGLTNTEDALNTIGKTGKLEFARLDSFTDEDAKTKIENGQYGDEARSPTIWACSRCVGRDAASQGGGRHLHAHRHRRGHHEGGHRQALRDVHRLRREHHAQC